MAQVRLAKGAPRSATAGAIGRSTRVHGRVSGEGDLVVEGRIEGDVRIRGDLTISDGAAIIADVIEAHAVRIDGQVDAQVEATGPVHLGPAARVRGDLKGSGISIDDGADFAGRIDCDFELPPELGGPSKKGR
jgi:cytoskeletal protein CcmA (bactofilin family)